MKEIMSEEVAEMIRVLEKANNALSRIFNLDDSQGELSSTLGVQVSVEEGEDNE